MIGCRRERGSNRGRFHNGAAVVLVWRVGTSDARQPPAASGSRVSPSSHEADPATRTERESIRLPHAPRTHLAASPRFTTRRRLYHASLTPYRLGSLRLQNYTHSDPYRGGGFSLSLVSWLPPLQRGANSIRKKKKNGDPGETRTAFVSSGNKYTFK